MRRFNPERELNKIQHGNKNKILYSIIALLLIISIGSTYALYQVRYSKRIIYTKVAPFSSKDLDLAVYIDGDKKTSFPSDTSNLVYTGVNCDKKEVKASWDYSTSKLDIESEVPNKCDIYFETRYRDNSGANYPELYQGLIPVTIDEETGEIQVADLKDKWYDYDAHQWANAVLVTTEKYNELVDENGKLKDTVSGTVLRLTSGPDSETKADGDILQMYVWIPRYKYQLFNAQNSGVNPQVIQVQFENGINSTGQTICRIATNGTETCLDGVNGQWYTHPAFTFGDTELKGIWVGKFESSEKNKGVSGTINGVADEQIESITILPNKVSLTNRSVSTTFYATRNIESNPQYNLSSNEVDTHQMKNSEWGAVAYLSQSIYGIFNKNEGGSITCAVDSSLNEQTCQVWKNEAAHGTSAGTYDGAITGCSTTTINETVRFSSNECIETYSWFENGVKASTTGNSYGIYDLNSGMWEYVMGNMTKNDGSFYGLNAGFQDGGEKPIPDAKYYDSYLYSATSLTHNRGHLGDATREVLKTYGGRNGGWNGDQPFIPYGTNPWFVRGSVATTMAPGDTYFEGIFSYSFSTGGAQSSGSFRVVLTQQDGNE